MNPPPNRLLLFDVDSTLLRGGPAKLAFTRALEAVYGQLHHPSDLDFSGKTDPQIVRELAEGNGLTPEEVKAEMPRVWRWYLAELGDLIRQEPPRILPGVVSLLDELARRGDAALGLVTGNLAQGARLKLTAVGLDGRFPVGAYGSDHEERNRLPGIAVERANQHWGQSFSPSRVVVVGDTPRDVECARAHGARCVAVATGRFSTEALARERPDHVLEDLQDTARVLEVLTEESD